MGEFFHIMIIFKISILLFAAVIITQDLGLANLRCQSHDLPSVLCG